MDQEAEKNKNSIIGNIFIRAYNKENNTNYSVEPGSPLDVHILDDKNEKIGEAEIIDVFDDYKSIPTRVIKRKFENSLKEGLKEKGCQNICLVLKYSKGVDVTKLYKNITNIFDQVLQGHARIVVNDVLEIDVKKVGTHGNVLIIAGDTPSGFWVVPGGIVKDVLHKAIEKKKEKNYSGVGDLILLLNDRSSFLDKEDIDGYVSYIEENHILKNPWGFKEVWFVFGQNKEAIRIA